LPAAYSFASYANVNGEKGRSLGFVEEGAVPSTTGSPERTHPAEFVCLAASQSSTVGLCLLHCVSYTSYADSIILCTLSFVLLLIPIISPLQKNIHKKKAYPRDMPDVN